MDRDGPEPIRRRGVLWLHGPEAIEFAVGRMEQGGLRASKLVVDARSRTRVWRPANG